MNITFQKCSWGIKYLNLSNVSLLFLFITNVPLNLITWILCYIPTGKLIIKDNKNDDDHFKKKKNFFVN